MIEFGKTLKAAREQKNYSISQMADLTNMMYSAVEDLEREDTTHIAAPIYGRGFVKLYCETVGLDPAPMVEAYMELYNRQHNIEVEPARKNVTVKDESPIDEPPPVKVQRFGQPELPPTRPGTPVEPQAMTPEEPPAAAEQGNLSRYASPFRQHLNYPQQLTRRYWRLAVIAAAALCVLWGIAIGVRALYRATTKAPGKPAAVAVTKPVAEKKVAKPEARPEPKNAKKRTPAKVAPLYID